MKIRPLTTIPEFERCLEIQLDGLGPRYSPPFYGEASGTQGGLPTDRVVAEWWLDRTLDPLAGEVRRIAIPSEIQLLKKLDINAARKLQQDVQLKFQENIADDF